jgi:hypothetical protein
MDWFQPLLILPYCLAPCAFGSGHDWLSAFNVRYVFPAALPSGLFLRFAGPIARLGST